MSKDKLDRVLAAIHELAPLFRQSSDKHLQKLAPSLVHAETIYGETGEYRQSRPPGQITNELLASLDEVLHPENSDPSGCRATARAIVEKHFPNRFSKIYERRDRLIASGRIKRFQDYSLIRAYVDETEGRPDETAEPNTLKRLYAMVADYEQCQR